MAASTHVNRNVATNFEQLLTEKLCQEHLQVLKTFTTALRDKQFRCVKLFMGFIPIIFKPEIDRKLTDLLYNSTCFFLVLPVWNCRRESVEEETFSDLSRVLSRLCDHLQTSIAADREPQSVVLQLTAECFRCQRNACVQNTRNQDVIRYWPWQCYWGRILARKRLSVHLRLLME